MMGKTSSNATFSSATMEKPSISSTFFNEKISPRKGTSKQNNATFAARKEPLRTLRHERWKGNPVRIWDNTSCCKFHSMSLAQHQTIFTALWATDYESGRRGRWNKSEDLPCVLKDFHLLEYGSISPFFVMSFLAWAFGQPGRIVPSCLTDVLFVATPYSVR